MRIPVFLLLTCVPLIAESSAERALRQQLESAQAELAKIKATGNATNAATATASQSAANGRTEAKKSADKQAAISSEAAGDAVLGAATQTDETIRASERAIEAAVTARTQAAQAISNNTSLIIVQSFTLLSLICGFTYKIFERRWDNQETLRKEGVAEVHRREDSAAVRLMASKADETAKEQSGTLKLQSAKLEQVHTLVNSRMTEVMEDNLQSQKAILALLQQAFEIKQANGSSTREAADRISSLIAKISELEAQLGDRKKQTEMAAARVEDAKLHTP